MLQRFRRITSGSSWIPQIDGLRFIAIASVLLTHAYDEIVSRGPRPFLIPYRAHWLTDIFLQGGRGVALFFVISGYILSRPFLRQHLLEGHPVRLGKYFLRRLTRLEPPYILALLLYFAVHSFLLHRGFHYEFRHTLASMAYLHNQIYPGMAAPNFVTWTLEIEIQFYILAPLLGNIFRIRDTTTRRGVILLLIAVSICCSGFRVQRYLLSVVPYLHFFLAGFLLADFIEYPRHAPRLNWLWDIVSLVGWPAFFLLGPVSSFEPWLVLLLVPLCLAAFHGKASNWFFRQPIIAVTGGMCYSLYLVHILVFESAFHFVRNIQLATSGATIAVQIALLLLPGLIAAAIYYLLIERPCMDPEWPRKLWHKLRPRRLEANNPAPLA